MPLKKLRARRRANAARDVVMKTRRSLLSKINARRKISARAHRGLVLGVRRARSRLVALSKLKLSRVSARRCFRGASCRRIHVARCTSAFTDDPARSERSNDARERTIEATNVEIGVPIGLHAPRNYRKLERADRSLHMFALK